MATLEEVYRILGLNPPAAPVEPFIAPDAPQGRIGSAIGSLKGREGGGVLGGVAKKALGTLAGNLVGGAAGASGGAAAGESVASSTGSTLSNATNFLESGVAGTPASTATSAASAAPSGLRSFLGSATESAVGGAGLGNYLKGEAVSSLGLEGAPGSVANQILGGSSAGKALLTTALDAASPYSFIGVGKSRSVGSGSDPRIPQGVATNPANATLGILEPGGQATEEEEPEADGIEKIDLEEKPGFWDKLGDAALGTVGTLGHLRQLGLKGPAANEDIKLRKQQVAKNNLLLFSAAQAKASSIHLKSLTLSDESEIGRFSQREAYIADELEQFESKPGGRQTADMVREILSDPFLAEFGSPEDIEVLFKSRPGFAMGVAFREEGGLELIKMLHDDPSIYADLPNAAKLRDDGKSKMTTFMDNERKRNPDRFKQMSKNGFSVADFSLVYNEALEAGLVDEVTERLTRGQFYDLRQRQEEYANIGITMDEQALALRKADQESARKLEADKRSVKGLQDVNAVAAGLKVGAEEKARATQKLKVLQESGSLSQLIEVKPDGSEELVQRNADDPDIRKGLQSGRFRPAPTGNAVGFVNAETGAMDTAIPGTPRFNALVNSKDWIPATSAERINYRDPNTNKIIPTVAGSEHEKNLLENGAFATGNMEEVLDTRTGKMRFMDENDPRMVKMTPPPTREVSGSATDFGLAFNDNVIRRKFTEKYVQASSQLEELDIMLADMSSADLVVPNRVMRHIETFLEKAGVEFSSDRTENLERFWKTLQRGANFANNYIKFITGAQMSFLEAVRLLRAIPRTGGGTGLFTGENQADSISQFAGKMQGLRQTLALDAARRKYALENPNLIAGPSNLGVDFDTSAGGSNPTGLTLDELMNKSENELQALADKHPAFGLPLSEMRAIIKADMSNQQSSLAIEHGPGSTDPWLDDNGKYLSNAHRSKMKLRLQQYSLQRFGAEASVLLGQAPVVFGADEEEK